MGTLDGRLLNWENLMKFKKGDRFRLTINTNYGTGVFNRVGTIIYESYGGNFSVKFYGDFIGRTIKPNGLEHSNMKRISEEEYFLECL